MYQLQDVPRPAVRHLRGELVVDHPGSRSRRAGPEQNHNEADDRRCEPADPEPQGLLVGGRRTPYSVRSPGPDGGPGNQLDAIAHPLWVELDHQAVHGRQQTAGPDERPITAPSDRHRQRSRFLVGAVCADQASWAPWVTPGTLATPCRFVGIEPCGRRAMSKAPRSSSTSSSLRTAVCSVRWS
jgi:hypothetical protein